MEMNKNMINKRDASKKDLSCGKCSHWRALNAVLNKGWGQCEYCLSEPVPKCIIRGYVNETDEKECMTFKRKDE